MNCYRILPFAYKKNIYYLFLILKQLFSILLINKWDKGKLYVLENLYLCSAKSNTDTLCVE